MKKSNKVKISNVEIEIGGKVIKLKLEEAKELKDILNDTFPEKETIQEYFPSPPIVIERPIYRNPWTPYWGVETIPLCSSSSTTMNESDYMADNTLRLTCSSEARF